MNGKKAKAARRAASHVAKVINIPQRSIYQKMKKNMQETETRERLYS